MPRERPPGPVRREPERAPEPRFRTRPMDRKDLARVTEVERASFSMPWTREAFGRLLDRPEVLCRVLEREEDPRVVGHAIVWRLAEEAELANIAVAPEARGRGLGGVLLDAVLDEVHGWGVRRVFLEVRRSDGRAQHLYRSRGFRRLGVRRNYYRRPREDAVIMARTAGSADPGATNHGSAGTRSDTEEA